MGNSGVNTHGVNIRAMYAWQLSGTEIATAVSMMVLRPTNVFSAC